MPLLFYWDTRSFIMDRDTSSCIFYYQLHSHLPLRGEELRAPIGSFWTGAMMLEHLGEKAAANRLMRAIERVTANPSLHTPDLGGAATTRAVTDATIAAIHGENA